MSISCTNNISMLLYVAHSFTCGLRRERAKLVYIIITSIKNNYKKLKGWGTKKHTNKGSKEGQGHPYFFLSSVFGCLFTSHFKLSLSSLVMMTKK